MRPYVILSSTMTIDGRLASRDSYSELSCRYDKERQHILRSEVDAVMVGANTARIDNPKLTIKYSMGQNPLRVIVTASGKLDENLRVFEVPPPTVVYTKNPKELDHLVEKGVKIRIFSKTCEILEDLYSFFQVKKVMVEGGGKLNWSLLKENCIDEIRLTISPKIFGAGVSVFDGEGFPGALSPTFKLFSAYLCQCREEIVITYKKINKK
ncbi:2,5-diamino-6-(ribosylamino)-4(3H)-pyrimidinone 5'-phosphate reductase [Metallosphaera tengchongensis]|uniref:2,5-diamino-6-(ribosylamino)-4(3H)-pyrimidinone 5'-phosphate reductase n=1 Tax=Metallosphaera tengchongensis TaxID=1532350 RepID=A0A6N0NUN3_9CREN|nr:2,5-diamino-6-(ribosylamino)-4(3H)-pyrimidinone 5'-phosphate reductase [Metallosphaera tengchongensis]QKQ99846.1 2,5-diamino-6-(ribosylamino)-4(3H)-pyrimidinone 5'-phosphate reductase [Metallosphaera tengchongensis]